MALKGTIIAILISSLFGYLEWGSNNRSFLFEAEIELFSKLFTHPKKVLHPFTIIPLAGQLILAIALFQKTPNFWFVMTGIACIAMLLLFMFFIGLSISNWKITLSVIPFILSTLTLIILKPKLF